MAAQEGRRLTPLEGRRVAVLTLSDSIARGAHPDTSGDLIVQMITGLGAAVGARDVLSDDRQAIAARLRAYADDLRVDLVLTAFRAISPASARSFTFRAISAPLSAASPASAGGP